MAEHYEYSRGVPRNEFDQDALQHYRIEIDKLKTLNQKQEERYKARVMQLEHMLRERGPAIKPEPLQKPKSEVYFKEKEIQQLRDENSKLRHLANKPDDILIKKKDNFDVIVEKDEEIARLKKIIHQVESKYDGKFFNGNKI